MPTKFIKSAIVIALGSAFCSVSLAATIGMNIPTTPVDEDINITGNHTYGLVENSNTNSTFNVNSSNVKIDLNYGTDWTVSQVAGIRAIGTNGSTVNLGKSGHTDDISVSLNNNSDSAVLTIGITSQGSATDSATIGPKLKINSKDLSVIAKAKSGWVYGIASQNSTTEAKDVAEVIIDAENTYINVESGDHKASALVAMSQGILKINGNLEAHGDNALLTRGDAVVRINETGKSTVKLYGDVVFDYDGPTSGTKVNADVNINLVGKDSVWEGNTRLDWLGNKDDLPPEKFEIKEMKLALSDGAQWNAVNVETVTGFDGEEPMGQQYVPLNHLSFNDGVINVLGGEEQTLVIENIEGTGGDVTLTASTDGKTIRSAEVEIGTAKKGTRLAVSARGITADDIKDPTSAMKSLNEKVTAESGVEKTNTIVEGDVRGLISQDVAIDGTTSEVQVRENTKLLSMKGVNAAALVAWRDEVAYTNQRMEFLRDNSHAYGAWAQVYGGESAYDDASVDLTTTTVQVGADATIGDWVAGAAFSYMTGDADMSNGQADTDAYTLSLYASRMFDSGLFVNGLARYGRLSTDATAGNMDGSYDNNAFSVGGNVGYRFTFAEQAFVEPMFGLQYAYVTGDDYKASNGVKVEQDDFDALIASLGVRTGFDFAKDAGKLYARASVNHDFLGEVDGTASNDKAVSDMYVDLGGTWFTYGVGTQFNITDNLSVWGNVDRTTGGEVSTRYMMNAGLRYVF